MYIHAHIGSTRIEGYTLWASKHMELCIDHSVRVLLGYQCVCYKVLVS